MAEDLVSTAISNLTSLYQDEVSLFQSVNAEREKLKSNLSIIKAVLHDAEKKKLAEKSDALNDWLLKLKDVVYELDDILDDCSIQDIQDEFEGARSCAFLGFLHPQKIMFRHNISDKMKSIRERLDLIAQEKDRFNFIPVERQPDSGHSNIPQWRQTTSFVVEDDIIGRNEDKEVIVHHILESARNGDTPYVYPIIGMGGSGKTSLAQLIYADQRVTKHFELKKWVCVSENFDLKILLKGIINSNDSPDDLDALVGKVQGMLQRKRYLIVLDDVWNEDVDKWIQLRSLLTCGSRESVVLITTRLEKVLAIVKTPSAKPHRLKPLSEDDCWQVFRKRAFGLSVVEETENLVRIGKEISRKCKGLPLAVKTLGGLLSLETNERSWHIVRDSEFWNLPDEQGSIMAALKLSYLNLSPQTQRCFSFCSIFPKDHEIFKLNLIHLWMANGLISERPSTKLELEDIGEMVINDLYWRSLIQDVERDDDSGCIRSFKMHDLVHDLAQSISAHECDAMEEQSSTNLSPGTHHISISYFRSESKNVCELIEKFESLRSLIFLRRRDPIALAISLSLRHTKLRALDWSSFRYELQELPSSLGVLKHLRYLNLSGSRIKELPDSIGDLWNLQTLNISDCTSLESLPASIGRLKNLRHLFNNSCSDLSIMPQSMVRLTSLRTLPLVVMGKREKNEFQLSGLQHMKYLRGKLEIKQLERIIDIKDVEKANLIENLDLHDLNLRWEWYGNTQQDQVHILEALRPSPRLRFMTLSGYNGVSFSNWMMNETVSFTCISMLQLSVCRKCKQLPPLWRLPSLKRLFLDYLDSISYLIENLEDSSEEECVCFPTLEELYIYSLPKLQKLIYREEAEEKLNTQNCIIFPCLSKLSIGQCPKLNSFNSNTFPRLQSLLLINCENVMLSMFTPSSYNLQCLNSLGKMTNSFTSLRELSIESCYHLKSLPENMKYLSSLEELAILGCRELEDISSALFSSTSLRKLRLCGLPITSLDTKESLDLPSLEYLEMNNCPKLKSLPNWMSHLVSLEFLVIEDCRMLKSIPESFRQLSKLKHLHIRKCPKLSQLCERKKGQDWHKIAHIPNVVVTGS